MARSRKTPSFTITEIIAVIQHSSYPSLVVEGEDDIIVFRKLEDEFASFGLTTISAGGRDSVLKIFEGCQNARLKAKPIFVVDRDCWIITDVPVKYSSNQIILTNGYSIENDMFTDGNFINLISLDNREKFNHEIEVICYWFAMMLDRFVNGDMCELKLHPNIILDNFEEKSSVLTAKDSQYYPTSLATKILSNYERMLRGKTLFAVLTRNTTGHRNSTLLDIASAQKGSNFASIREKIRIRLEP